VLALCDEVFSNIPSCCIEYGGNECEFDKCPDADARKEFVKCYLSQLPLFSDVDRSEAHRIAQQVGAGVVNAEHAEQFLMGLDVSNPIRMLSFRFYSFVPLFQNSARFMALAALLMWGAWGVIQGASSIIDFDFQKYSSARLNEYRRRKAEFKH
jgi:hypothetical protein